MMALKPSPFQACFTSLVAALLEARERSLNEESEDPSALTYRHVAIAGKTVRNSHDRRQGLGAVHLVGAWAVGRVVPNFSSAW